MLGEYSEELLDLNDSESELLDALDVEEMIDMQHVFEKILNEDGLDFMDDDFY